MKRLLIILSLAILMGCATAPAEVTYEYNYVINLFQTDGSEIGDIELLLETHKSSESQLDTDASATTDVSPEISIPLDGL